MPGDTTRRVDVQVLRTMPEMWLPPDPGAVVERVSGADRDIALFVDQMEHPLALGLDAARQPVFADFSFINGEKGGHISISGISGVATKTSYALFTLYMLFETPQGRALLGAHAPNTKALVFNVKGEDLLHLDRPNSRFATTEGAREGWAALGVEEPGPFRSVRFYSPRSSGAREGSNATDVVSRAATDVRPFGWTPERFIREGLLRYCFAEEEDSSDTGLVHRAARPCPAGSASASTRRRARRGRPGCPAARHDVRLREAPAKPPRRPTRQRRRSGPRLRRPGRLPDRPPHAPEH